MNSGSITVFGWDVARHAPHVRAKLGSVPQETALYEDLTAVHTLRLHADLHFVPRSAQRKRIADVLELVQLTDRAGSRLKTFSGGMKRRLALARALIHEPPLLILDEPTLGVDVQSRRALWDRVLQLRDAGATIVTTTNYLEEADLLCDRIAIIDHGRLMALGSPAELRTIIGTVVVNLVLAQPVPECSVAGIRSLAGVHELRISGNLVTATVDHAAVGPLVTLIAASTAIRSIRQAEPTLDAVFLRLTGTKLRDSAGRS